ncbi:Putative integral membrane protein [hydrothermal vent metagenome]|uniref:Putative integral membrane protein n=1 Tax=hydrothermal vent metagenome TaxID=652676 RepID=A0A1W1EIH7_9ZZZZ
MGEAVTYNKLSPIFVAIFAYIFMKEKLSKYAIFAVILGFIGITLIAKPDGFILDKYSILGIFSGIGAALAYTSIRELRKYYDTRAIVLSFMITGSIFPLFMMITAEFITIDGFDMVLSIFKVPSTTQWIYIVGMGLFATISQILMTKAYELSKAGIVGTISYSNIIFATIIGVLLGDNFPDIWTILGIGFVIGSGILVAIPKNSN